MSAGGITHSSPLGPLRFVAFGSFPAANILRKVETDTPNMAEVSGTPSGWSG
jgi:hypothetical protein